MITSVQWKRVVRPMLGDPADWSWRGKLTYRRPAGWTIRGIFAEGSRHKDSAYIWVVRMPLYVPAETLILSQSDRVPNGSTVHTPSDGVSFERVVKDALAGVPNEHDALTLMSKGSDETAAYSLVLLGKARRAHRQLSAQVEPHGDDRPFVLASQARQRSVLAMLDESGEDSALEQMRTWRRQTINSLGLGSDDVVPEEALTTVRK